MNLPRQEANGEGWFQVPNGLILELGQKLGPFGIAVYCYLSARSGSRGYCWPSVQRIAADLNICENSVRGAVAKLEDLGLVEVKRPATNHVNVYTMLPWQPRPSPREARTSCGEPRPSPDEARPSCDEGEQDALNKTQRTKRNEQDTPQPPRGGNRGRLKECPGFEEFWEAYPRKEAKQDARKAWNQLQPDPLIQTRIADALSRQRISGQWTREGGRFVLLPARYLRGRRWEDETRGSPDDSLFAGVREFAAKPNANGTHQGVP